MIWFLKKKSKDMPPFWTAYEKTFDQRLPSDINEIRFVVLDTETTGFNYDKDRMLCIGAISLTNGAIPLQDSLEVFIEQDHYDAESAKIHGILKRGAMERVSELLALQHFLEYVGNAVVVAHHAKFDITMINRALERNGLPKLKNKVLDTAVLYKRTLLLSNLIERKETYKLDELADKFDISKKDRHTALGDAYITAIAFLKILKKLRDKNGLKLKDLFR
tara:strand:- start:120334 stop:120993 length:660 start_codon:yes stop_codon:yes gene_type:complete